MPKKYSRFGQITLTSSISDNHRNLTADKPAGLRSYKSIILLSITFQENLTLKPIFFRDAQALTKVNEIMKIWLYYHPIFSKIC